MTLASTFAGVRQHAFPVAVLNAEQMRLEWRLEPRPVPTPFGRPLEVAEAADELTPRADRELQFDGLDWFD